ncbi:ABC transporter permease [Pseudoalteromonas rubra]|uniref:ABC transporter permease n=1 Tax=Pseudoalteromonas rubra TaxID=43658 RepID=A0A4Q7E0C0_9GAMM|nr:Gldg family protein [Pseudoalteromonas rubra]RZM73994.1 ABC transporter permease [Pseudoalteromonas rubra]
MQHNATSLRLCWTIAAKELGLVFSSPLAYLFLLIFGGVALFTFFWAEAFFARNIADIRPLFEWLPVLMIFLSSAFTMRLWSDERRTGTLEFVYTQPLGLWQFVLGKFIACVLLLLLALAITLVVPLSVSFLAELDWGPVWSGYLATVLLGSVYLSIGLFVSARTDNPIISFMLATCICVLLYVIGSEGLTGFFGHQAAEVMRLVGTGSRFESIARGVLDLRDLYYYLSLILVFLLLNVFALERARWVDKPVKAHHKHWHLGVTFAIANLLFANLWLYKLPYLRVDTTQGQQYSISTQTKRYLQQLEEPLLIRGYFSAKTHPLLAPLVPQMRDLIAEYEVAGAGKVRVEFIDPQQNPQLEEQANREYGIRAMPFQVEDRYQSAIVSSYFDILVKYGDQYQVLGFRDLIEVNARGESDLDVVLRNPEYDLTRTIKSVLEDYRAEGQIFDMVDKPLTFNAYVSAPQALPEQLNTLLEDIRQVMTTHEADANGKLSVNYLDPAEDSALAQRLAEELGMMPMRAGLLSSDEFYFYLTLENDEQVVQLALEDFSTEAFERSFDAAVEKFAQGLNKHIALVMPDAMSSPGRYGQSAFSQVERLLAQQANVKREDLSDGHVDDSTDLLLLLAPESLDEQALFAVDQFMMRGGTVVAATSPYQINLSGRSLSLTEHNSGLQAWLAHHGVNIPKQVILDEQHGAFPVPVTRNVGGLQFQEIQMLEYPYFVDVRAEGLNKQSLITRGLAQVTVPWSSGIDYQGENNFEPLLRSSEQAWQTTQLDVMPSISAQGEVSYPQGSQRTQFDIAAVIEGRFTSYFADKPLTKRADEGKEQTESSEAEHTELQIEQMVRHSPEKTRLIVFSSNAMFSDQVLGLIGSTNQSASLNNLALLQNTLDWALEDDGLLGIRARGHFNRTLPPLTEKTAMHIELFNYGVVASLILIIALVAKVRRTRRLARHQSAFTPEEAR